MPGTGYYPERPPAHFKKARECISIIGYAASLKNRADAFSGNDTHEFRMHREEHSFMNAEQESFLLLPGGTASMNDNTLMPDSTKINPGKV
jgi:hypothetical protein